jgi:hypothetical protein
LSSLLLAAAIAALTTAPAAAQQASAILDQALARYEARMKGIENYTIVQSTMGTSMTTRYERQIVDGHTVFTPAGGSAGEQGRAAQDMALYFAQLRAHARYEKRENVVGHDTHVIRIEGSGGIDWNAQFGQGNGEAFVPEEFTMYVDTRDYVVRRVIVKGNVDVNGTSRLITNVVDYGDYREVSGMLHPFLTTVRMEGAMQAADISPAQRAEAEASLAKLEKKMAEVPESQRRMMENMLGGQLKMLRDMVKSNALEVTIEVQDLRVNETRPMIP